jgi:hypothetical protein
MNTLPADLFLWVGKVGRSVGKGAACLGLNQAQWWPMRAGWVARDA